jgi:hypothetical protein
MKCCVRQNSMYLCLLVGHKRMDTIKFGVYVSTLLDEPTGSLQGRRVESDTSQRIIMLIFTATRNSNLITNHLQICLSALCLQLHSSSKTLVQCSWNVMAHGDAGEGKWRGNWRMEWVASTLHTTLEHGVSSITTADAHTSAASRRMNWRPCRFKWTRPFRRKTKFGFCACAITFQTQSTTKRTSDLTSNSYSQFTRTVLKLTILRTYTCSKKSLPPFKYSSQMKLIALPLSSHISLTSQYHYSFSHTYNMRYNIKSMVCFEVSILLEYVILRWTFTPWRWDCYRASKHLTPITQRCSVIYQMSGDLHHAGAES